MDNITNPKSQEPNPKQFQISIVQKITSFPVGGSFGVLDIRICLEFAIWNLEFPVGSG
jgi:hypothetical protein